MNGLFVVSPVQTLPVYFYGDKDIEIQNHLQYAQKWLNLAIQRTTINNVNGAKVSLKVCAEQLDVLQGLGVNHDDQRYALLKQRFDKAVTRLF